MTAVAACRAKDPSFCPYHGAVLRLEAAERNNDLEAYLVEKANVDRMSKSSWEEDVFSAPLVPHDGMSQAEIDYHETGLDGVISNWHSDSQEKNVVVDVIDVKDVLGYARRYRRATDSEPTPKNGYSGIRIQAKRKLTRDEVQRLAALTGYFYQSTVRTDFIGVPYRDTPFSFCMSTNDNVGRPDLDNALWEFRKGLNDISVSGTRLRKVGPNAGTRLLDGLGEDLGLEIFYGDKA